jgi:hypothetical protein
VNYLPKESAEAGEKKQQQNEADHGGCQKRCVSRFL